MKKNRLKKIVTFSLATMLSLSTMGLNVHAEEAVTTTKYEATDAYVLKYNHELGHAVYQYFSPYKAQVTSNGVSKRSQSFVFCVQNTKDPESEFLSAYCVDSHVGHHTGLYRRINLSDATYLGNNADVLRSVILNSFPNVGVEELGEAAGIDGLTVCEAVSGTQLAIWKLAHGDAYVINDYYGSMTEHAVWAEDSTKYPLLHESILEYAACRAEVENGYAQPDEDNPLIQQHIIALFDYLTGLEPTEPTAVAVSEASFVTWSEAPELVYDETDKLYDVTVEVTVNVDMDETKGDELTLSAVLGDGTYYADTELKDGVNDVTITIENVPIAEAKSGMILAIDGLQTVSDVFLYDVEGDRDTNQSMIGMDDSQLPVHAEVKVEPERIIEFEKYDRVVIGEDLAGNVATQDIPLEGIVFDVYFVADWNDYVTGKKTLPAADEYSVSKKASDFTVVTDENGKASISLTKSGMPDGVYLVVERENIAIKEPVAPFYVMVPYTNDARTGYEYVITAQPKNDVKGDVEIEKDVITVGNDEASVNATENHTWIISTTIPLDISKGKEYTISDTLDNRLDYMGNVKVQVEYIEEAAEDGETEGTTSNSGTDTATEAEEMNSFILKNDKDYVLTVVDNDSMTEEKLSDSFTLSLKAEGMEKIGKAVGDQYENYKIRVYFDAKINGNAKMGAAIPNQATLKYTNSVNFDFDRESDIPVVYTCGIDIMKQSAKDATPLGGAQFELWKLADEVGEDTETLVTSDGNVVYVEKAYFYDNQEMSGEKTDIVTSAEDDETTEINEAGPAYMYGLEAGEYYLVETKAPKDYNLLRYPIKITLDSENEENIVNTKGHSVHSEIVLNSNAFRLPETGGMGTTVFTTSGMVMLAAAALVLMKKRENEEA